jgi:hypothetical protein
MPDSNIPLQPEDPRPISRDEAQLSEQEAWTDPSEPVYEEPSYRRPSSARPTQQPTYRQSPYGTPSQRRGWTSFGCLPTLIMLLLLLCCSCNPLNTMFTPASSYDANQGVTIEDLLYGY